VAFECGLGCLLAAWLMLPAGWAMLGISRSGGLELLKYFGWYTWSATLERLRAIWMPIESGVVHAFYGDASSWASVAAFLPLCGCALALWQALTRPKSWVFLLLPALTLISIWPFSNRLFTLGSSLYYTRWWYGLALMLCVPTVQALEALSTPGPRDLRRLSLALWITLGVSLCLTIPTALPDALLARLADASVAPAAKLGRALLQNKAQAGYAGDAFRVLAWGLAALNLGCLWLSTRRRFLGGARVLCAALAVAAVANYAGFIAVNDALAPVGEQLGYPTGVDYYARHILLEDRPAFTGTTYAYRVDAPPKVRNYGMLINQPAVTSFHSLRSNYLNDFVLLSGFGYSESPDAVPPDMYNGAIRTLLGVRTFYNYDEDHYPGAPEGFVYAGKSGEVSVYENPFALPLGFAYDRFTNLWHQNLTPVNIGQVMLQGVVLDSSGMDALSDLLEPLWEQPSVPWQEAAAHRAAMACYDVEATPRGLTAKIDLPRERLVYFSVQYDRGWSATVNGAPATLYNVNLGCIGLRVPAGQGNEIVLRYFPRGLREGAWISAGAALTLALYLLWGRRRCSGPLTGRGAAPHIPRAASASEANASPPTPERFPFSTLDSHFYYVRSIF
jgi:hypothetical protein